MKPKIYALGKIWKSEANGQVYHGGGALSDSVLWSSQRGATEDCSL